jgi:hypothetical protein
MQRRQVGARAEQPIHPLNAVKVKRAQVARSRFIKKGEKQLVMFVMPMIIQSG